MSEYAFEGPKRNSATITWSFATQTLAGDASIAFGNPIGAAYQATIQAAFARWASVSGLTFDQVADSSSVAVRVGFASFATWGELGETDYRSARGVLAPDTVIRLLDPASIPLVAGAAGAYYYSAYDVGLFQVVLHEIGHALGLAHTTDPDTIMYPYASDEDTDLAAGDIYGVNMLYPYFTVVASNPVQSEGGTGSVTSYSFVVTRYGDPAVPLSINYAVTGAAYAGVAGSVAAAASEFVGGAYPSGVLSFAAGSSTAVLTVQVAGNETAQADQGFAIGFSSPNTLDSVVVRGAVSAVVLDDDGTAQTSSGALGIYRFFDTTNGTHFMSSNKPERNAVLQTRPDLVYEGIGLAAVGTPAADPAAAPVFRFFETNDGTHLYTASATERDMIVATRPDLVLEGIAFYEHVAAQAGDAPVYRYFDLTDGTHFYTSSAAERVTVAATRPDLQDEGVAFYAPSL